MTPATARRSRTSAAWLLLSAFVLAAQLAPVAHLATHRNDHTHGAELATFGVAAHEAAHRAGVAHQHAASLEDGFTPEEREWLYGDTVPPTGGPPSHDHGHDSVAHFALALNQGPPPAMVPPPSETIAAPPDVALVSHDAPALPAPPTRGPPA